MAYPVGGRRVHLLKLPQRVFDGRSPQSRPESLTPSCIATSPGSNWNREIRRPTFPLPGSGSRTCRLKELARSRGRTQSRDRQESEPGVAWPRRRRTAQRTSGSAL